MAKVGIINLLLALVLSAPAALAQTNLEKVLDWVEGFDKKYGHQITGLTTDGKACEFNVFKRPPEISNGCPNGGQRAAYISLSTSSTGQMSEASYTTIGFPVNPECNYTSKYLLKSLDMDAQSIHINVVSDGEDAENDLVIRMDRDGNTIQVRGTSSNWAGASCWFGVN